MVTWSARLEPRADARERHRAPSRVVVGGRSSRLVVRPTKNTSPRRRRSTSGTRIQRPAACRPVMQTRGAHGPASVCVYRRTITAVQVGVRARGSSCHVHALTCAVKRTNTADPRDFGLWRSVLASARCHGAARGAALRELVVARDEGRHLVRVRRHPRLLLRERLAAAPLVHRAEQPSGPVTPAHGVRTTHSRHNQRVRSTRCIDAAYDLPGA